MLLAGISIAFTTFFYMNSFSNLSIGNSQSENKIKDNLILVSRLAGALCRVAIVS